MWRQDANEQENGSCVTVMQHDQSRVGLSLGLAMNS